jgi:hypothetical protein
MRDELAKREGHRVRVQAKIERYGSTPDGSRYLLVDVRDAKSGELLTEHLWMSIGPWAVGMREGDVIAFDATVAQYVKGYFGRRQDIIDAKASPSIDYHLDQPANAQVVIEGPIPRIK